MYHKTNGKPVGDRRTHIEWNRVQSPDESEAGDDLQGGHYEPVSAPAHPRNVAVFIVRSIGLLCTFAAIAIFSYVGIDRLVEIGLAMLVAPLLLAAGARLMFGKV